MQLWDFERWLCDLLAACDGIASAEGFTPATGLLYGVTVTSTSGTRVLIHLTRGSGPHDVREIPQSHRDRVAALEGVPSPDLKPLSDRTADAVERLVRVAIERAAHPDVVYAQTFAERRPEGEGERARAGREVLRRGRVLSHASRHLTCERMDDMNPLHEPDRLAFCGDWHANARWAAAAIEHARQQGANTLIHVGDFAYTFDEPFIRAVIDALFRMDMTLLFVDGNHDDHDFIAQYPIGESGLRQIGDRLWHIPRGFRWQWGGLTWLGCGGAHSVDRQWREPGVSWWAGEAIGIEDTRRCMAGGPADVLVAHDCPSGVDIPGLGDGSGWPREEITLANAHRDVLREIATACRPGLIVHGHYHRAYRAEVDLGYGRTFVRGLGMDGGEFEENVWMVDLNEVKALAT